MEEKCELCDNPATCINHVVLGRDTEFPKIKKEFLCDSCNFKITYSHSKDCLEEFLKELLSTLKERKVLSNKQVDFLRIVQKEMPEMVDKFPNLFNLLIK